MRNGFKNHIHSRQSIVIPESQYAVTGRFEVEGSCSVVVSCLQMLTSVEFNDECVCEADEIDDVWADAVLPAEFPPGQLP